MPCTTGIKFKQTSEQREIERRAAEAGKLIPDTEDDNYEWHGDMFDEHEVERAVSWMEDISQLVGDITEIVNRLKQGEVTMSVYNNGSVALMSLNDFPIFKEKAEYIAGCLRAYLYHVMIHNGQVVVMLAPKFFNIDASLGDWQPSGNITHLGVWFEEYDHIYRADVIAKVKDGVLYYEEQELFRWWFNRTEYPFDYDDEDFQEGCRIRGFEVESLEKYREPLRGEYEYILKFVKEHPELPLRDAIDKATIRYTPDKET